MTKKAINFISELIGGALFVSCGEFYTRKDGLLSFPCFGEPCGNISDYRIFPHKY